jgi:carbon monoxide dehydrogenase subunit G
MEMTAGRSTYTDSPTSWPHDGGPIDEPNKTDQEASWMAPIVSSIEIARPQDEVFSYVTDPSTFAESQAGVVGGSMEGGTSPSVGSKCTTTRRIGSTAREVTSEITKIDPPTRWAVHGIDGPIRAIVNVTVEPLNVSAQSRVTIELDFEGHGIGKLLVPLVVRRQARREMPANCRKLKQRLETMPSRSAA